MWTYVQSNGDFFFNNEYIETGYSGKDPEGKNKPDKECDKDVGPIPRGYFTIGAEKQTPTPVTLMLTPENPNYCNPKRDNFLIHGDNIASPGTASIGCIILARKTRERVRDSVDKKMRVVKVSTFSKLVKQRIYAKPSEL